ncbi:type II toxin-antitoxin system antitoxin, RelB/DinJ family [Bifidobacterium myosotis]|uniref:Type II toxin-antitoxin system antitoxin, RelB/DinJ family n=1 Tax=Bifidobacterium myosotis TaxID=1630166 RepID=A0A5M9ZH63_9BIFI|nr:type II toxin-antitoxin system antitoxin, RelB/DinJ family [Bifidobacterium myosotis]
MTGIPTTTTRIDPRPKEESGRAPKDLGPTLSGAAAVFPKAVVGERSLPFGIGKGAPNGR